MNALPHHEGFDGASPRRGAAAARSGTAMARNPSRARQPASACRNAAANASWADWFWQFQAFQVHAVRDVLTVYNHCVASLASSRDAQTAGAACQAALRDWAACVDGVQHEWLALSKAMPADALAAWGWRLKPGARLGQAEKPHEGTPDLFEQSRLGVEMLLRPWLPAPDLDHTDDFVA